MKKNKYSPGQVARMTGRRYGAIMRRIRARKLSAEKVGWGWVVTLTDKQIDALKVKS